MTTEDLKTEIPVREGHPPRTSQKFFNTILATCELQNQNSPKNCQPRESELGLAVLNLLMQGGMAKPITSESNMSTHRCLAGHLA